MANSYNASASGEELKNQRFHCTPCALGVRILYRIRWSFIWHLGEPHWLWELKAIFGMEERMGRKMVLSAEITFNWLSDIRDLLCGWDGVSFFWKDFSHFSQFKPKRYTFGIFSKARSYVNIHFMYCGDISTLYILNWVLRGD